MNLSVGIVGLPNVGKSTLFNALLKKQAALAANYPFATIEPNVGIVPVPDERLKSLAKIIAGGDPIASLQDDGLKFPPIVPATVEFVDIAGLVKGASEGAGLGNKFLSHIREVSVIAHVVRNFEDEDVIREGSVDAKTDYETIRTELILADLATLENHESRIKNQDEKKILQEVGEELNKGNKFDASTLKKEDQKIIFQLNLLSLKPEICVINVSESEYTEKNISEIFKKYSESLELKVQNCIVICAKIESELSELSEEDQSIYLSDLGIKKSGLERLIQIAYQTLGLQSFLTAGEKEVRAWTIKKGATALEAAGEIHTDFMQKFIKAEVVSLTDFVELGGWKAGREKGRARMEGRDYVMQDGDVVEFKIGR